ncbi:hypothetical protein [Kitasatospora cheerisanensis]|uniref:N-acetylglutamate synthase n=1 Tax=Kitasatospora cheerisanensis KCTC 2395 TaxID=1348663 RepID=A0A066Z1A4_9ACTN|nr:hypothetical protein [Kitasatospora cheerisanensis]KDN87257.1 hypothetical protein KCH_09740 [Kitasatospora cheerisanensis KCTC 2395]
MLPSLDGLLFAPVARPAQGEVDPGTRFAYRERDGLVWAGYRGGEIVHGHLVGTRTGNTVEFRYVQLNRAGETNSGHCVSELSRLADGRLRLDERWEWESRAGSGTSAVEEVLPGR